MSGKGTALGVIGAGGVFLWAGVKGYSVTQVIQDLVTGKAPVAPVASLAFNVVTPAQATLPLHPGTGSPGILAGTPVTGGGNKAANIALAQQMAAARGWTGQEWTDLFQLWDRESARTWSPTVTNPTSGAYGIPQSLPADKMASAGADWRTNPATQIEWGLDYIAGRYGSPSVAWQHELSHNWY